MTGTALDPPPHRTARSAAAANAHAYSETLDRVRTDLAALQTAVDAAVRVRRGRRAAVLADLHHRARTIAAALNHALGGWPGPDDGGGP